MRAAQMIKDALEDNPDILLVLEIAMRARELESREPPRELSASTEVAAIPTNPQCAL
jgi:hypothetical protein